MLTKSEDKKSKSIYWLLLASFVSAILLQRYQTGIGIHFALTSIGYKQGYYIGQIFVHILVLFGIPVVLTLLFKMVYSRVMLVLNKPSTSKISYGLTWFLFFLFLFIQIFNVNKKSLDQTQQQNYLKVMTTGCVSGFHKAHPNIDTMVAQN